MTDAQPGQANLMLAGVADAAAPQKLWSESPITTTSVLLDSSVCQRTKTSVLPATRLGLTDQLWRLVIRPLRWSESEPILLHQVALFVAHVLDDDGVVARRAQGDRCRPLRGSALGGSAPKQASVR